MNRVWRISQVKLLKFLQTPILLFKPENTNSGIFMATNILQPNFQNYCVTSIKMGKPWPMGQIYLMA